MSGDEPTVSTDWRKDSKFSPHERGSAAWMHAFMDNRAVFPA